MKEPEIRCPQCAWRPKAESRWACVRTCGTEWNTFWTAGVCPGCGKAWHVTQCPSCNKRSPHKNWYRFPGAEDETADVQLVEKARA